MYSGIDFSKVICVTNRRLVTRPYFEQIERVARLHPKAIILREKDMSIQEYKETAWEVNRICQQYHVPLIINFFPTVAVEMGLANVQLSLAKMEEYAKIDPERLLLKNNGMKAGCSVHSVDDARKAESLGAAFLVAGHVFDTDCKKGLPGRGIDFLRNVVEAVAIPVYAIGGIKMDAEQMKQVLETGAKGACMMSELMEY